MVNNLEYVTQVFDPYLIKNTELLERVQGFALTVCCKYWSASYCDLLESCQVPRLSDRRKRVKPCHLLKSYMGYRTVRWHQLCIEHSTTAATGGIRYTDTKFICSIIPLPLLFLYIPIPFHYGIIYN